MTLFFLPLLVLLVLVALLVALAAVLARAVRSALLVKRGEFQVTPNVVRPGEGMRVWARVVSRRNEPLAVSATLACTLFAHRPRRLHATTQQLASVVGRPGEYAAFLQIPPYALRTGAVGDELSSLFSEDAHRLLVAWSVELDVRLARDPTDVLLRTSIPIDVPDGRALQADRAYMDDLIVQTCSAMQSDLVLNWLVRLAAADGEVAAEERRLLHDILRARHGVLDPQAADARIAIELQRNVQIDAAILRKHLAPEDLAGFYRVLYAMAWRDGQLDGREHNFLVDALERFGLDAQAARQVEMEVLHGAAQRAMA